MSAGVIATHAGFALALFFLSAALTEGMVRFNIADIPNARSSHARPTPTGGGLAVAFTFFLGITTLFFLSSAVKLPERAFLVYLGLAGLLVVAALVDDFRTIRPWLKLTVQIFCAGLFTLAVSHFETVSLPGLGVVHLGLFGSFATILWIVSVMNLVNFMDGINGLVSGTAIIAAATLAILALLSDAPFVYLAALVLTGCTAGFFVHNFPWGRIFLGDTGSQFLGFALATLAVIGASEEGGKMSAWLVPILILPLLFDAVLTLALRALRGEDVTRPHRDHIYQLLVRAGLSHAQVSALYFSLTVLCAVAGVAVQLRYASQGALILGLLVALMGALAFLAYRFANGRQVFAKS
jgi:UDP-N-acetylmuramyl pentapeptide phosphotransferase/UDP-N-acetylglucosamine-1-phosphate transferase